MKLLKHIIIKYTLLITCLMFVITLAACESKINSLNIHGTYVSNGMMGYEAIVENGTITIYSITPFERSLYWHGTCNASELDKDNKLISRRIETESDRNWFFSDFGSMGKSRMSSKEILFTDTSLTFIYDMSGISVSQETLYKKIEEKHYNGFDSNAETPYPGYVVPSEPLPHELPRGYKPTEEETETAPSKDEIAPSEDIVVDGKDYTL